METKRQTETLADQRVPERWLRLKQILAPQGPVPISRSAWYRYIEEGKIPKGTKLGPRITVWRESDVIAFLESKEAE